MQRLLFVIAILLATSSAIVGQQIADDRCPIIDVEGPSAVPRPGEPMVFSARVDTKGNVLDLKYQWDVSHGVIASGQGTLQITVMSDALSITANLRVDGVPKGCTDLASESFHYDPVPAAVKLGEFAMLLSAIDPSRLENLRNQIRSDPRSIIWVFVGSKSDRRSQEQIDDLGRVDLSNHGAVRVIYNDVKSEKEFVEIWRAPAGADPPVCENCLDAPTNKSPSCPTITVTSPAGVIAPGELGHFTATIDPPKSKLGYTWSMKGSADIVSGQGTTAMQFQMRKFDWKSYDLPIIATLTVSGLPAGCPYSVSETFALSIDPHTTIIGEILKPPYSLDRDLMNEVDRNLRDNSHAQIYIIVRSNKTESDSIIRNIKNQASSKKFDLTRLTFITAEEKYTKVSIFLVPAGADAPTP
jgi:hypothetical protein